MNANKFGWTMITLWIAVALFSLVSIGGCQSYDYIHEKGDEVTKLSIDIIGTDSVRSGLKIKLPTLTFDAEKSTLDTESIQKIVKEFGNMPLVEILKVLGAL